MSAKLPQQVLQGSVAHMEAASAPAAIRTRPESSGLWLGIGRFTCAVDGDCSRLSRLRSENVAAPRNRAVFQAAGVAAGPASGKVTTNWLPRFLPALVPLT